MKNGSIIFKNYKKIHIVAAAGTEGTAVALFLKSLGTFPILHDFRSGQDFKKAFHEFHSGISAKERIQKFNEISNLELRTGENYLKGIEEADLIVVPQSFRLYKENQKLWENIENKNFNFAGRKIPFKIIDDFYFEFSGWPIIGATGTNGKTTVKRFVTSLLENYEKKVLSSGNDRGGEQMLPKISLNPHLQKGEVGGFDFTVLELSHRKLQFLDKSPNVAIVTNITEDHLDETGGFENYVSWKQNIAKYQTENDFIVLNFEDSFVREKFESFKVQKIYFSLKRFERFSGAFLNGNLITVRNLKGEEKIVGSICDLNLIGEFNQLNLLASISATIPYLDLNFEKTSGWIKSLRPPENRLQVFGCFDQKGIFSKIEDLVRSCEIPKQVRGDNFKDSSSTKITIFNNLISRTPDSTIKAIDSIGKCVLILGGNGKNSSLKLLAEKIKEKEAFCITLPGSGSEELGRFLNSENFEKAENFESAIKASFGICKEKGFDKILVSPTFAGFQSEIMNGKGLELYF